MPTYEDLLSEIQAMRLNEAALKCRIAYLERMLYGSKRDRRKPNVPDGQPGLFDEFFKEAIEEKTAEIEDAVKAIEKQKLCQKGHILCGVVRAGIGVGFAFLYVFYLRFCLCISLKISIFVI